MRALKTISATMDFFAFNATGQIWDVTQSIYVDAVDANVANYRIAPISESGGYVSAADPAGMDHFDLRFRSSLLSTSTVYASGEAEQTSQTTGPGASANVINILNTDTSQPVADADVWISTDLAGDNVVAGPLQTDSDGNATFMLDAGVQYYLWMQKDGVNSILGSPFTAT